MRKLIIAVMLLTAIAFAGAPSAPSISANISFANDSTISSAAGFDTLAGATDSSIIMLNWKPEEHKEYVLTRDAITGTGSDSIKVSLSLYAYDQDKNLLYITEIDSFTAAGGESIAIPVGETVFGNQFTLKARSYTANGGQVILNRMYLYARKLVTIRKTW